MSVFKKLFFVEQEEVNTEKKASSPITTTPNTPSESFPVHNVAPTFHTPPKVEVTPIVCTPYIEEVIKVYEEGFNSLNQEGYDFFEFFKAISKIGIDNNSAYEIAFTMASSMDSSVSKESLIEQSKFYVAELKKVYEGFVKQGQLNASSIEKSKAEESKALADSLQQTRTELERLKKLEQSQADALGSIDAKYDSKLQEVKCKIEANDVASKALIEAIEQVVNGIKTNIK